MKLIIKDKIANQVIKRDLKSLELDYIFKQVEMILSEKIKRDPIYYNSYCKELNKEIELDLEIKLNNN